MSFDILCLTPCSITYELRNDAIYEVDEEYFVYLDGLFPFVALSPELNKIYILLN